MRKNKKHKTLKDNDPHGPIRTELTPNITLTHRPPKDTSYDNKKKFEIIKNSTFNHTEKQDKISEHTPETETNKSIEQTEPIKPTQKQNVIFPILTQKRAKFLLDHVSVTDVSCDKLVITVRECPTESGFFGEK